MSGDLGELSEELQSLQALRRSSSGSRCVHEHHCGSQASVNSVKASQGAHGLGQGSLEFPPFRGDFQSSLPPFRDLNSSMRKKSWPSMKPGRIQGHHGMVLGRQDRVMEEDEEDEEDGRYDVYVRRGGSRRGNFEMAQQRSLSMDFWKEKTRLARAELCTFTEEKRQLIHLTFFIVIIIIMKKWFFFLLFFGIQDTRVLPTLLGHWTSWQAAAIVFVIKCKSEDRCYCCVLFLLSMYFVKYILLWSK